LWAPFLLKENQRVLRAALRRRLMLSNSKPPIPSRISDVGSGFAESVIELKTCAKVNVAVAFGTPFGQLLEPAFATSTNAITAKTAIPKNARVTFIELDVSSLDLPAGCSSSVGNL